MTDPRVIESTQLTPSQERVLSEIEEEGLPSAVRGWDGSKLIVEMADGGKVLIGPRGGVDEVGSNPVEKPIEGEAEEIPVPDADPEDFKPPAEELMVREDEGDLYRVMDRADEALILEEIQGNTLATMLYSFPQGGSVVTDLTVHGVTEIVRLLNERGGAKIGIAPDPPAISETEDGYRVMVRAIDLRTGVSRWGIAEQEKQMKSGQQMIRDKFALTKALNKAERNALAKMIPEQFKQTVIAQFLGTPEAVKTLKPVETGAAAKVEPPLKDDEAVQLQAQIHDRYDKFKALGQPHTMRMTPAAFNAYFSVAASSHQNMRALIAHIETITEEEAEKKRKVESDA